MLDDSGFRVLRQSDNVLRLSSHQVQHRSRIHPRPKAAAIHRVRDVDKVQDGNEQRPPMEQRSVVVRNVEKIATLRRPGNG